MGRLCEKQAFNCQLNDMTVSQWFIKREKKREKETLKQGLRPPPQVEAASSQPLPAAVPLPPTLPQVSFPLNGSSKGLG